MKPFTVPAQMTAISFSSDGGLRLSFHTQELNQADKAAAGEYHQSFGYLCFKPNEWSESEIPKEQAEDNSKTPAQRLRAVLFLLWNKSGKDVDFDMFYRRRMELLIEQIKERLD